MPTTDQLLRVLLLCLIALAIIFIVYGVAGLVARAIE